MNEKISYPYDEVEEKEKEEVVTGEMDGEPIVRRKTARERFMECISASEAVRLLKKITLPEGVNFDEPF